MNIATIDNMNNMERLKDQLPDFAKDIKLNLHNLFANISSSGLTESQFYGTCLAVAYSLKNKTLIEVMRDMKGIKDSEEINGIKNIQQAAKIAATIMAMNNIYYRAIHLADDQELAGMPANLRMNMMINPGVPNVDFELYALAVSAINGCGMCIESHVKQLVQHQVTKLAIQTTLRIAAVLHSLSMVLFIKNT